MKNKKIFKFALLFMFIATMCSTTANAQPGYDDDNDVSDVPVDGGISLLLIGGAALGLKKAYKAKQWF